MYRSMLMGPALAALFAAWCLGGAAVANAAGYDETDFFVGGPDAKPATTTTPPTLTDANGVVHSAKCGDPNPANCLDPDLVNAWGLTESTTTPTVMGSPFWISDNGSGKETLYNVPSSTPLKATKNPRVVSIPSPDDPLGGGTPTGNAWNPTSRAPATPEFNIRGYLFTGVGVTGNCSFTSAVATFLFVTEDGTIVGWNSNLYPTQALCLAATVAAQNNTAIIAVDNSARGNGKKGKGKGNGQGAVYKGLAISSDANGTFLYAANFRQGRVEIYDGTFALLDTFTDKKAKGYAPFNISLINGQLFVTFAVQNKERHDDVAGPGNGIVETFDLSGNMLQVFAQGGVLNSPWGLAVAPTSFGDRGGRLWIGNFGDGKINAFDLGTGASLPVNQPTNPPKPIVIDGLWSLKFGNDGNGGSSQTLYFTAGPNGEADGLFGALSPHP